MLQRLVDKGLKAVDTISGCNIRFCFILNEDILIGFVQCVIMATSSLSTAYIACSECKSEDVVTDFNAGDVICRACGVVLCGRIMDETQEWNNHRPDDGSSGVDSNRVGAASLGVTSDNGLTTILDRNTSKKTKSGGRMVATPLLNEAWMQHANTRTMTSMSDLSLLRCCERVREIADVMGIPSAVVDAGSQILMDLQSAGQLKHKKGPLGDAICAAVLYIACRENSAARTLKEIAPAANVEWKPLTKAFKKIARHIQQTGSCGGGVISIVKGEDLIPRYCSQLGLDPSVAQAAKHVARKASELELDCGRSPCDLAAAAICFACSIMSGSAHAISRKKRETADDRFISEPAEVAEVAKSTVKSMGKTLKLLFPFRHQLVPDHLSKHISCLEQLVCPV